MGYRSDEKGGGEVGGIRSASDRRHDSFHTRLDEM